MSRIAVTPGVVLSRSGLGENDRLASVYTRDYGRLPVRFVGVLRPRAKLRAFAEPFVRADFRLYLKVETRVAKCVGGALLSVHPGVRADLRKTMRAFLLCELLERLTPEASPNPAKYELIEGALGRLDAAPADDWLTAAYALRLLELAGLGLPRSPSESEDPELWRALREGGWEEVGALPSGGERLSMVRTRLQRHLEAQLDRPLRAEAFVH